MNRGRLMRQLAIVLLFLGCVTTRAVPAQVQVSVSPEDHFLRTFLLNIYPDLDGKPLRIQSNGQVRTRDVAVFEVIPSGLVEPRLDALVKAHVEFSAGHALRKFSATGPLLRDAENSNLSAAVQRTATAAGIRTEISRRNLAFGPDRQDAVLAKLQTVRLDSTIGPSTVVRLTPESVTNDPRYGFLWTVQLQATRDGDTTRQYDVQIEPFGGRVVSVTER